MFVVCVCACFICPSVCLHVRPNPSNPGSYIHTRYQKTTNTTNIKQTYEQKKQTAKVQEELEAERGAREAERVALTQAREEAIASNEGEAARALEALREELRKSREREEAALSDAKQARTRALAAEVCACVC